ncbi:hypothetical protein ABEB36_000165 [Hypothenemus hampei]|uniref:Transposable element P transposase-like RNase H domain-containing protein n=1 Tax=Hypothenemus hampei TaxID=57062 RepID=A0ABD1FAF6_HYPHA
MDLMEHVQYDLKSDRFVGFENLGEGHTSHKLANKALVFMFQGICRKFLIPSMEVEWRLKLGKDVKCLVSAESPHDFHTICTSSFVKLYKKTRKCRIRKKDNISLDGIFRDDQDIKCDMCVFDMMNVIIPVANSRNRVNAYEFAVDEQNVLFDKMTSFVENMQMIGTGKAELPINYY